MRLLLPTFLFGFLFGCGADCRQATPPVSNVCRAADVPFFINDRPDLALELGADCVHVG